MGGIALKVSVNVRTKRGAKFPRGSYAAALSPARAALAKDVQRAFDSKSDPVSGHPWQPRKTDLKNPMLVKTGAMRSAAIAAAQTAVVNGNTLTARVKTPAYSKFQQKGTRTIAARRFIGASIGTVRIVQAGLKAEGKKQAVRVLRGRG